MLAEDAAGEDAEETRLQRQVVGIVLGADCPRTGGDLHVDARHGSERERRLASERAQVRLTQVQTGAEANDYGGGAAARRRRQQRRGSKACFSCTCNRTHSRTTKTVTSRCLFINYSLSRARICSQLITLTQLTRASVYLCICEGHQNNKESMTLNVGVRELLFISAP